LAGKESSLLPVLAIAGPSGSGKSRLADDFSGRILHVELDRFYRSRAELVASGTRIDWEDTSSYQLDAACEALGALARNGPASIPIYDLASDAIVGSEILEPEGRVVLAEGIFASIIANQLTAANINVVSICLIGSPLKHAYWRILRDIRERRLPFAKAIMRGVRIMFHEHVYINSSVLLSAQAMGAREISEMLDSMISLTLPTLHGKVRDH
jgi:uridine kinase